MRNGTQFHFNLKPVRLYSKNEISSLVIFQNKNKLSANMQRDELRM